MYIANDLYTAPRPLLAALDSPLLHRWAAWLQGKPSPATKYDTCDSAAALYARAASYESSQPSFAADLRAAAEAMDHVAAQRTR